MGEDNNIQEENNSESEKTIENDKEIKILEKELSETNINKLVILDGVVTIFILIVSHLIQTEIANMCLTKYGFKQPLTFHAISLTFQLPICFCFLLPIHYFGGYDLQDRLKRLGPLGCWYGLIYGIINIFLSFALQHTTPHLFFILSQSHLFFVFILSLLVLKEKFDAIKFSFIMLIFICVCNIGFYSRAKSEQNQEGLNDPHVNILGVVCTIVWGICEAFADIILGKYQNSVMDPNSLFLDVLTLLCVAVSVSALILGALTAYTEGFTFPQDGIVWGLISIHSFFDCTLCLALFWGMYKTNPLFIRVGGLIAIPLGFVIDYWRSIEIHATEVFSGSVLILCVFMVEWITIKTNAEKKST